MDILTRFKHCPVCGGSLQPDSAKSMRCHDCGFEYFVNASAAYVALIYDERGRLLVVRRRCEPAKGTLDLPGGFADMGETVETGVARKAKGTDRWFIGGKCNEDGHQSDLRLDFLDKGKKYVCTVYADAKDADYEKNPKARAREWLTEYEIVR